MKKPVQPATTPGATFVGVAVAVGAEAVVVVAVVNTGAGTAVEGSTSAPVPHEIIAPSGWVLLVGGVVAPVEEAIVKRVVHS